MSEFIRIGFCVGLVIIIVFAMDQMNQPGTWARLYPARTVDTSLRETGGITITGPSGDAPAIEGHALLAGGVADPEAAPAADLGPAPAAGLGPAPVAGLGPAPVADPSRVPPAEGQVNPLNLYQIDECTEIDRDLMNEIIRDKTPDRAEESELIWQTMCVASTTPPEELAKKARRDVLFANLANDPKLYRGVPIHRRGVLKSLIMFEGTALENAHEFPKYYDAWVFTEDQPDQPTKFVFSALPDGLMPGENLQTEIEFDAFFFKLVAFRNGAGKAVFAPMLVGYRPRLLALDSNVGQGITILLVTLAGLVVGVMSLVWWQNRRDQRVVSEIRRQTPVWEANPPDFQAADESKPAEDSQPADDSEDASE